MADVYDLPEGLDESWIDDWLNEDGDDPETDALYPADPDILRDITDDDTRELPAVSDHEPGSWDELVALNQGKLEEPLPVPEAVAWRLDTESLTTPEGDTRGYALYCTRFPESADPVPEFDTPQRAERLEMAHFASEEQAKRFETEFRSYLVPGLIDGPELAEEVAKLEGMPGEWVEMNSHSIVNDTSGHLPHPNGAHEQREKVSVDIDF